MDAEELLVFHLGCSLDLGLIQAFGVEVVAFDGVYPFYYAETYYTPIGLEVFHHPLRLI